MSITYADLIATALGRHRDAIAFEQDGRRIGYAAAADLVGRLERMLESPDIAREAKAAIVMLYSNFEVDRVSDAKEVHEGFAFTMSPVGLRVRLRRRAAAGVERLPAQGA